MQLSSTQIPEHLTYTVSKTQTPANRHKDRCQIHSQKQKYRISSRRSIHRKIAEMKETRALAKKRNSAQNYQKIQEETINYEQFQRNQKLMEELRDKRQYKEKLLQKIAFVINSQASLKKLKEIGRETFHTNNLYLLQLKKKAQIQEIDIYNLKKQNNNLNHKCKEISFKIASQEFNVKDNIMRCQMKLQEINQNMDEKLQILKRKTQLCKTEEMRSLDLKNALMESEKDKKIKMDQYKIELSQVFVLKFQLNNNFCGFMVSSEGCEKKQLLEKDYQAWEKSKQKKYDESDLRRFVLIYLYKNWRVVLRKLSYQSSQYQVLFGQIKNQLVLQDLKRLLSEQKPRSSHKKQHKAIIYYSQLKIPINRKEHLASMFQNFNNGLIRINRVSFISHDQIEEMQIHYTYLDEEQLVEKFIYEDNKYINKDKIMKDMKMGDRRVFSVVEVPVVAHKDDILRYEEVYDLVKKRKFVYQGGQRSLSK